MKNTKISKNLMEKKSERERFQMQYFACISGSLASAACIINTSWTSPAVPYLKSNDSKFPLTDEQGSWIVSIYNFGEIIGTPLTLLFIDTIGRKHTLLLYGIPAIISWLIVIFASNYIHIYIARLIAGIGHGFVFSTVVIYLAEISEKNSRITLFIIMRITMSLVGFIAASVGSLWSYENLNFTCLSVPILFVALFAFMPESPYYLLLKDREEEAIECLMKLRGKVESEPFLRENLAFDINEMKLNVDATKFKLSAFRELLVKSSNRRAMLVVLFLKITQFMSGHLAILGYTVEIFSNSDSSVKPQTAALILAGIRMISSFAAGGVMNFINIKVNFLISGILGSFCLSVLGMYFFLKNVEADVSSISWVPLVALISFEVITYLGIAIIPFIIQGELFPMEVKAVAAVYGTILGSICTFASTIGYSALNKAIGIYASFWLFAFVSFFGSIVTFFITPETTGKTLEEIQAMYNPELKKNLELVRLRRIDSMNSISYNMLCNNKSDSIKRHRF